MGPLEGYQFSYDTRYAGAGELLSATFPYGGQITWNYGSFEYSGEQDVAGSERAVGDADAELDDADLDLRNIRGRTPQNSGDGPQRHDADRRERDRRENVDFQYKRVRAWQIGLVSDFQQLCARLAATSCMTTNTPGRRIRRAVRIFRPKTSISDEGQSYQQSAYSTQMLDRYGNVTTSAVYPYNNQTTPLHTYVNTFITNSNYTNSYIYNLLSKSVMDGNTTLVSNYYDTSTCQNGPFGGSACGGEGMGTAPTTLFDSKAPTLYPGALTTSVTLTKAIGTTYYVYGGVSSVSATDSTNVTASADASTNYAAPLTITAQNYSQAIAYNAFLGITSQTGANGEQLWMTYDAYGRPTTGTSPYGAVTTYTYGTIRYTVNNINYYTPYSQTETGPNGVTITVLDGFGRPVLVATRRYETRDLFGDAAPFSMPAPVRRWARCNRSHSLINLPRQTLFIRFPPHPWTTYTYDGLGRPVSVQGPDGASTTTYFYSGNQTTVTDPAGNWKQFTKDVLGNLTTVVEPDPNNQPGGTLTTSYAYNWMEQVTQVSMPRGSTTQTRTFVYDSGGRLTSATNPENGTVTYTYNVTNTLKDKHDAKGQDTVYTYDSSNRVTEIQRYPSGVGNAEDVCARVTYTYDTNPIHSGFSQNSYGRLTTTQYYGQNASTNGNGCGWGGLYDTYTEMYSYQRGGCGDGEKSRVRARIRPSAGWRAADSNRRAWRWTTRRTRRGELSTVTYPMSFTNSLQTQPVLTMAYDAMGRPSSLTDSSGDVTPAPTNWVSAAQYDFAGRLTSLNYLTGPVIQPDGDVGNENV